VRPDLLLISTRLWGPPRFPPPTPPHFLGGAQKIDKYVSLTPLWDGTTAYGLSHLYAFGDLFGFPTDDIVGQFCESCTQFLRGSEYLQNLHDKGVFHPDVDYTNIVTKYEQAVVPYTSGLGEGDNVTNIVLQDECRKDYSDHAAVAFSPNAAGHVLNALDPGNAEDVPCTFTTPLGTP
jgi:hypothetical protein